MKSYLVARDLSMRLSRKWCPTFYTAGIFELQTSSIILKKELHDDKNTHQKALPFTIVSLGGLAAASCMVVVCFTIISQSETSASRTRRAR